MKVVIDGKVKIKPDLKKPENVIDYAEDNLVSKNSNVIIFNDYETYKTVIEIYDENCNNLVHRISFINYELKDEQKSRISMRRLSLINS